MAAAAAVLVGLAFESPRASPVRFARSPVVDGHVAGYAPVGMVGAAGTIGDVEAAAESPFTGASPVEPVPVFDGGLRARKVFIENAAAGSADELTLPFQEGPR
jgi:hypothetical protein